MYNDAQVNVLEEALCDILTQPCAVVSNFKKLHQGYSGVIKLLGVFSNFML